MESKSSRNGYKRVIRAEVLLMMELGVILTSVTLPDKRPMDEKPLMRRSYIQLVDAVRTAGTFSVCGTLHSVCTEVVQTGTLHGWSVVLLCRLPTNLSKARWVGASQTSVNVRDFDIITCSMLPSSSI